MCTLSQFSFFISGVCTHEQVSGTCFMGFPPVLLLLWPMITCMSTVCLCDSSVCLPVPHLSQDTGENKLCRALHGTASALSTKIFNAVQNRQAIVAIVADLEWSQCV